MNLRVTAQTRTGDAIANMRMRSADLAKYQDQVSSGVRIKRASDDPTAYPQLARAKSASARLESYSQSISNATTTLNAGVSALQDVTSALTTARQIAIEGASADTAGEPANREALATQVDGLINRVLATVNARPDGQSLFSGTATNTAAFSIATTDSAGRPATIAYDGSDQRARTVTARNTTTDTRYVGSAVFQQSGADTFASLIALRDELRNNPSTGPDYSAAMNQRLADLDAARTAIGETTGEQASNLATLESQDLVVSNAKLDSDSRVNDLIGTDYPMAIVKMQEQQTALQAIYAVTAQLADPGLLAFIGR